MKRAPAAFSHSAAARATGGDRLSKLRPPSPRSMADTVLEITNLAVTFDTPDEEVEAVKGISLTIDKGECLGIVGESGSGKSQTFLAAFGLSSENAIVTGQVKFQGREVLTLR